MLGISLLIFVLLLMIVFVIASLFLSKQQTANSSFENELDELHKSIIQQYDHKEKPPK
ncbi:hypothetical protein [Psychrobacillus glaciei]|uniref:hypothetical protein n=1 Tax=Psychrobacillus glaciei TaxID=2283160 RepID=UPI00178C4116|nr:hypothetical protein [Psychrobacillus glaciei]